jgi:hypothetical protein
MARPMNKAEWIAAMTKWNVPVKWYPGWDTRGRPGDFSSVNGVVIHHTGSDSQTDAYVKWLFTEGRASEGIPAPLCHVCTDFDGDVHVGAIGRANHAGKGSSTVLSHVVAEDYKGFQSPELRPGADNTDGNAHFYGNEVRYDGGQNMTVKQFASAVRWATAICDHYGWSALSVVGHREWTTRKNDPGMCSMYTFRAAVAALLKAGPKIAPPKTDITPGGTVARTLTDDDLAAIGAVVKFQNEDYGRRLWAMDTGTGKRQVIDVLADHTARLIRIEDDTDDGTVTP